jgi:threonine/homoserine/homoserine lactone efflux protein
MIRQPFADFTGEASFILDVQYKNSSAVTPGLSLRVTSGVATRGASCPSARTVFNPLGYARSAYLGWRLTQSWLAKQDDSEARCTARQPSAAADLGTSDGFVRSLIDSVVVF